MSEENKKPTSILKSVAVPTVVVALLTLLCVLAPKAQETPNKKAPAREHFFAAHEALVTAAAEGCGKHEFSECKSPSDLRTELMSAMDKDKVPYSELSQRRIDDLTRQAKTKIIMQKYDYLRNQGGAKYPSELKMLGQICCASKEIYPPIFTSDLLSLLPPDSDQSKIPYCDWPYCE